jgi:hypothetical protein
MAAEGYASKDVEAVYDRAWALCKTCGEPADLVRALRGHWNIAFLHVDLSAARDTAQRLLTQAEALGDAAMRADSLTKLGRLACIRATSRRHARICRRRSTRRRPRPRERERVAPRASPPTSPGRSGTAANRGGPKNWATPRWTWQAAPTARTPKPSCWRTSAGSD